MELIKTEFASIGVVTSLIGGRSENQDYYGFRDTPLGQAVVVCDGMGGMQGGQVASTIAVTTILNALAAESAETNPVNALEDAIKLANATIIETGSKDPNLYGMGTTVTALILSKTCATVAFVGDSRIYQLRGRKKVFRTFDHSMVFEMVKNGVMTEEQARLSEQSNIILKALGVYQDIDPDIYMLPYLKDDRFVLCSDGFWGAMPEKEFLSLISDRSDKIANIIECTASEIERIGRSKGGNHDNLTAAIIDVKCNSLMKVKMSNTVKAIIAALVLLLAISVSLNIYQLCKSSKQVNTTEQTGPDNKDNEESEDAKKGAEDGRQSDK